MIGESPMRPQRLLEMPPVEVPAARPPCWSRATAPTVPRSLAFAAFALSRSSSRQRRSVRKYEAGTSVIPCSFANASAPSAASRTCRAFSITRRASTIGFLMCFTPATAPARRVPPSITAASSSFVPALVNTAPLPALNSGESSSTVITAMTASRLAPPPRSTSYPARIAWVSVARYAESSAGVMLSLRIVPAPPCTTSMNGGRCGVGPAASVSVASATVSTLRFTCSRIPHPASRLPALSHLVSLCRGRQQPVEPQVDCRLAVVVRPILGEDHHQTPTRHLSAFEERDAVGELRVVDVGQRRGAEIERALERRDELVLGVFGCDLRLLGCRRARDRAAHRVVPAREVRHDPPEGHLRRRGLVAVLIGGHLFRGLPQIARLARGGVLQRAGDRVLGTQARNEQQSADRCRHGGEGESHGLVRLGVADSLPPGCAGSKGRCNFEQSASGGGRWRRCRSS